MFTYSVCTGALLHVCALHTNITHNMAHMLVSTGLRPW